MSATEIRIRGARQHNLKDIHLSIPRDRLVVITGLSGSGKSSLAFDTLYAEGHRRYVESLSAYARQFVGQMDRPDVDGIDGLSPAIAVDQRSMGRTPRSTVGTATEIHDLLRVLFARVGRPYCPTCGSEIPALSVQEMKERLLSLPVGTRLWIYAPVARGAKGAHRRLLQDLVRQGFLRVRVDGTLRELGEEISLDRDSTHDIDVLVDRLELKPEASSRLADSLETALRLSEGLVLAEVQGAEPLWFSERPLCLACGKQGPELTPKLFSFNDPQGACPACKGLGSHEDFDPELVVPDPGRSLREGAIAPWAHRHPVILIQELEDLAGHYGFDIYTPFGALPEEARRVILYGSYGELVPFRKERGRTLAVERRPYEGVIPWLRRAWKGARDAASRRALQRFMTLQPCPACHGARLRPEALAVRLGGATIGELSSLSIAGLRKRLRSLDLSGSDREVARDILQEVERRLGLLERLGVEYLSLGRSVQGLSGGEAQRVRLATQMGSTLVGVLYVLDEPSIGLHPRDQARLLETLREMRDTGNSVVVVEHDPETIMASDFVVDMGPGAGEQGGRVIYAGPPEGLVRCPESLTGAYLSGRRVIPIPRRREVRGRPFIEILGAREHNLKGIDVRIPLGCLTCVTGVSGSGKSTLVVDTLYRAALWMLHRGRCRPARVDEIRGLEAIDKAVDIDQSPVGRSPRSNPATYTGIFHEIRALFSRLPESRARGYGSGRFSFNARGGRCETCKGEGVRRVEMHFLPDVYATCDACKGARYNADTLEIRYKGLNIAQVLGLTVSEALRFFENVPALCRPLRTLQEVGLGYLRLGQAATTLSGGEAQRIKLARELSRPQTGRTLFTLDEPTTGLHFGDVERLLDLLQRLIEAGNTVVVIEHNLEVIKSADWVIDLGPGGGDEGGRVVACGTPEEVAAAKDSATGSFLRKVLST
jgi:excinuclease ABC subunit A